MPPPSSKGLSQCGEVFNISSIGGVLSTPNGTNLKSPISGDRSTLSGGRYCTDRAVAPAPGVGEGSRDAPSPHPRGSVSAGKYSISVVPEGSSVYTPNGTNLISGVHCVSGGRYCTDRAVAPAPGVGEGSRDAPSPHPRGSVSAGKYSVSVVSEGSSVYTPNGTNLISGVHCVSGGRYCTDRAVAPAPGVGEGSRDAPSPHPRGSVSAGKYSVSVVSEGSSVYTPNGTNLISGVHCVSGGRYCTDRAVAPAPGVGEGSRDAPSPHPRGSVSAGKYSVSVVSEGSSVYTPNGTNLISGVHCVSGGRYCTDRAVAPAPGVGEGSRDAPSLIQGAQSVRGSIQYQ
jgi:Na+-transporting NADH:ubiquinone oxidoreductase subunit NqrA